MKLEKHIDKLTGEFQKVYSQLDKWGWSKQETVDVSHETFLRTSLRADEYSTAAKMDILKARPSLDEESKKLLEEYEAVKIEKTNQ